jgi:hypothetical protein
VEQLLQRSGLSDIVYELEAEANSTTDGRVTMFVSPDAGVQALATFFAPPGTSTADALQTFQSNLVAMREVRGFGVLTACVLLVSLPSCTLS